MSALEFCEILETKFRFYCYEHCKFYVTDIERNTLLIKLEKTFVYSHRVSDSFENTTVKIRSIHYEQMKADHRYF